MIKRIRNISPAFWITAGYIALSQLWILASEHFVEKFASNVGYEEEVVVGLGFVFALVTGAIMYTVLVILFRRYENLYRDQQATEQALRDSESLYRTVFESSMVPVSLTDENGKIIAFNDAMLRLGGYTAEDVAEMGYATAFYLDPNDRQAIVSQSDAKGYLNDAEIQIRSKAGIPMDIRLSRRRITIKGQPAWHTIARDVTEQKRAERALHDSEERFRRIFEDGPIGMSLGTSEGGFLRVNRAMGEMLGYSEDEILKLNIQDITYPDDVAADMRQTRRMHGGEIPGFEMEKRLIRKDGTTIWVNLASFLIHAQTGAPLYGLRIVQNITDRKRTEVALKESEERYRRLAENAPDLIFRWTIGKGFDYVNLAAASITGYEPHEFYDDRELGYRMVMEEDLAAFEKQFTIAFRGGAPPEPLPVRVRRKDGEIRTLELRVNPVLDGRGELIAVEGVGREITQQHIDRERLRELGQRLVEAHEEERRRVGTELHEEVGQLLSVARMRLEIALNQVSPRHTKLMAQLHSLGTVLEESLGMVRSLSQELRPPLLDELGWHKALVSLCENFSRRSGLEVEYQHSGKTTRLRAPVELAAYRIVQEALTNALRHAHASRVTVRSAFTKADLRITIQDNGTGFDVNQVRRAQQPEVGLGLLLMQERSANVDGTLRISSRARRGTSIVVRLPGGSGDTV